MSAQVGFFGSPWPLIVSSNSSEEFGRRNPLRRFGVYLHLYIIAGIAVPVMIYLAVMQYQGWRIPSLGWNGVLSYDAAPESRQIILYTSPTTRQFMKSTGGNQDNLLTPWREYFADRKLKVREVSDVGQLHGLNAGVLVLPSVVAMSAQERSEITAFRARGGAVLSTWATGARDESGGWLGWQFLRTFGVNVSGDLSGEPLINHLILNGESPLSYALPAGQRIFMNSSSEPLLRAKGADADSAIAARFMNWARIPSADHMAEGAVLYSETTPQAGRFAYFAFSESAWSNHPAVIYSLFDNTISWLRREPAVVRAAWPGGRQAAHVVEMDTEEGFPNALNFAGVMQEAAYPATFFVLTSTAKKFPEVLSALAQSHEIGFHGDLHNSFKDQPQVTQALRIRAMLADLNGLLPAARSNPTQARLGFRAPTEGYDSLTEGLLQQEGLRYHVADPNRGEARLPLWAHTDGSTLENDLLVLPRTQRDDINLLGERLSGEALTEALDADAALVLDQGALGLLSVHTQNFGSQSVLAQTLPRYLKNMKQRQDRLWLASAGQVAAWWREREHVKLNARYSGKLLEIELSVLGSAPVQGASVMVMLPQKGLLPNAQSAKLGGPKPTVLRLDAYRAALVFKSLPPGNYAYRITF